MTLVWVAVCLALASTPTLAQEISIYITPYYDSEGPVIRVGKYSRPLSTKDPAKLAKTIDDMQRSLHSLTAVEMYVAAIRLFEVDRKEDSVAWFYAAQLRSQLFLALRDESKVGSIGDPSFEIGHANNSFFQLAGPYINGFAFCDKSVVISAIDEAMAQSAIIPDMTKLYPKVKFMPRESWQELAVRTRDGLKEFRENIDSTYDEIKAQRDESGITKEYCGAGA